MTSDNNLKARDGTNKLVNATSRVEVEKVSVIVEDVDEENEEEEKEEEGIVREFPVVRSDDPAPSHNHGRVSLLLPENNDGDDVGNDIKTDCNQLQHSVDVASIPKRSLTQPQQPQRSHRPHLLHFQRFRKKKVFHRKQSVDIETGTQHVLECHPVADKLYYEPMNPKKRRRKQRFRWLCSPWNGESRLQDERFPIQYRLTNGHKRHGCCHFLRLMKVPKDAEFEILTTGLNNQIADFLIWTFETNFLIVFLAATAIYISCVLVFGILFYFTGQYHPECIVVSGTDFNSAGHYFSDAFALSWQTYTTAGYGAIYPSYDSTRQESCPVITAIAAIESFWGVLFASSITAIIFSKISRVMSVAAVEFSVPILVRYGTGVMPAVDDALSEVSSSHANFSIQGNSSTEANNLHDDSIRSDALYRVSSLKRDNRYPCPVLEFRVMNRLHDQVGGEICNASVNVVAITASKSSELVREAAGLSQREFAQSMEGAYRSSTRLSKNFKKSIQTGGTILQSTASRATAVTSAAWQRTGDAILRKAGAVSVIQKSATMVQNITSSLSALPEIAAVKPLSGKVDSAPTTNNDSMVPLTISMIEACREHLPVTEDPSNKLLPPRIFSKLEIETDKHPLFKRVWTIRHVLNESSPLLSDEAKRLLEQNQGFWPVELNSFKNVREHIRFLEIIINFKGTSNVCGVTVYSQKVYGKDDMNIGYKFANMLLKDRDGKLVVDSNLLNDVNVQFGGGNEPFANVTVEDSPLDVADALAKSAAGVAVTSVSTAAQVTTEVTQTTTNVMAQATAGLAYATENVKNPFA